MKTIILFFSTLLMSISVFSQSAKIVGYLPAYKFELSNYIEYCKLTHLNLAFANPDSNGNIIMPSISTIITEARNQNPSIIICISLAGGVLTTQQASNWINLIDTPANRPAFIAKILDYVLTHNLDGIDVDLEWDNVTTGYTGFITELDAALSPHNKILTVALPNQTLFSNITSEALAALDFINIMSYDATGPWNPTNKGQHSSYDFAVNGINFWKNTVGISGDKLTLGVPFYGYDFINSNTANAFTYASMVSTDAGYANIDKVENAYYNGMPTIRSKVALARDEVGGIMIWELSQDSFNEYSLLSTIHKKYNSLGITTTGLCGNDAVLSIPKLKDAKRFNIYPNPASEYFTIALIEDKIPTIIITDILGQILPIRSEISSSSELRFDLSDIQKGIYFISIITKENAPITYALSVK